MSPQEIYKKEFATDGGHLAFHVYKRHGQTPRLKVTQRRQEVEGESIIEESLIVCEEDLATLVQGMMEAIGTLGVRSPQGQPPKTLGEIRKTFPNAYRLWTQVEDARLLEEVRLRDRIEDIAVRHGRQPSAIESRIAKLALSRL